MLLIPTIPFVRRRKRLPPPAAPSALVLVAAVYDEGNAWVRLTFDRPVDVSGLVGGEIRVNDPGSEVEATLAAIGAVTVIAPAVVQIGLVIFDPATSPYTRLNAGPHTGILATNDGGTAGGTWPGVTDLPLPFP